MSLIKLTHHWITFRQRMGTPRYGQTDLAFLSPMSTDTFYVHLSLAAHLLFDLKFFFFALDLSQIDLQRVFLYSA